jgi:type IV secretion system protein VirB10
MSAAANPPSVEAAPDLSIRARPPSPRRLSRKVLLAGALSAAGIVALALFFGLSDRPDREVAQADAIAAAGGPPESIRNAANQYDAADLPNAELDPPRDTLWGGHPPPDQAELAPPEEGAWVGERAGGEGQTGSGGPPPPDPQAIAQVAPILFGDPDRSGEGAISQDNTIGAGARGAFLASQRGDDARLDARLTPPRSRYELIAGAVIPAALVTELNSDLPGRAIAQVTANVYDSVSGEHLLIPQGSRLLGAYDSANSYGDKRLLLVWNRLVFPNGWSISLRGMEGTDPSGAAGLRDRTDNHLDRLAGAIGLSAIISVIAENSEDDDGDSLSQSVGDAAAAEAARTGGRIVDRELSVRPTLRIRAGGAVRVLVTRDIQLRPYRGS